MAYRSIGVFLLAGLALFSPVEASAQQKEDQTLIEAQALGTALQVLAEEYDLQVLFETAVVANYTAQAIPQGTSRDAALGDLLSGTDLTYEFVNERTVAIRFVNDETVAIGEGVDQRGTSDSGNVTPRSVLMAQNTSQTSTRMEISSGSDDGGASVVTGKVTDARTGANLKGALVRVEETGQSTSTDDLGEFRLVNVPQGTVTITVSYLGYAGQSAATGVFGPAVSTSFALRGGSEIEEIVVFGQRSARAQALNQERTADNFTTVLSSDLLGQFNGTTISEALRRAPGVAFIPNAETGEGANVIVRGLDPDLSQVTLNGLRLAEGSGQGRSADLSGILTESIESVTINKTLLPSQDSNGAGGLVEIETKSPLDRPKRFTSFGVEHGWKDKDFAENTLYSGTVSGKFLSDDSLGISGSVQYRESETTNLSYSANSGGFGLFLPEGVASPFALDPRVPFPFEAGVVDQVVSDVATSETLNSSENLSLSASVQKKFGGHSDLRLDVTRNEVKSASASASLSFASSLAGYEQLPVDALGGALRAHWVTEDRFLPGIFFIGSRNASYSPETVNRTLSVSLRGQTNLDEWLFTYAGGFVSAETEQDRSVVLNVESGRGLFLDPSLLSDEVRNVTVNGRLVSPFPLRQPGDQSFIFPGFSVDGESYFNDGAQAGVVSIGEALGGNTGGNDRYSVDGSVRRSFSKHDWLEYVELGVNYEIADFGAVPSDFVRNSYFPLAGATLADIGIDVVPSPLSDLGVVGAPSVLTAGSLSQLSSARLNELVDSDLFSFSSFSLDTDTIPLDNREAEFSAYVQSQVNIGDVEIIGGVRVSKVDIETEFYSGALLFAADGSFDPNFFQQNSQRIGGSVSQTDILPRFLVNYRHSDNMIFRAGYFSTFSRPQVRNLSSSGAGITLDLRELYGVNGDQPQLRVVQGNPDLKPSFTQNFDASWEYYTDSIGVFKVSAFFKTIDDFLQFNQVQSGIDAIPDGVTLPDVDEFNNLPDNILISVSQPRNSEDSAELWGVEVSVERQLSFLPGFWSNFGLYANYAYADSSRDEVRFFNNPDTGALEEVVFKDEPFSGSPKYSGTAAITYSSDRIDASLIYTEQDRRRSALGPNGLSAYDEAVETLDFRAQYGLPLAEVDLSVFVEGRDLLTSADEPFLGSSIGGDNGVPQYYFGGSYLGGREFRVGIRGNF